MLSVQIGAQQSLRKGGINFVFIRFSKKPDYLLASSIATATATVIPTMGLLPAPMRPIISTSKAPFRRFRKENQALFTSYIGDHAPIISCPLFNIQYFSEHFYNFHTFFIPEAKKIEVRSKQHFNIFIMCGNRDLIISV